MQQLNHYTLQTGDGRLTDRSEVDDSVVAALLPLVRAGGGKLPYGEDWSLLVTVGGDGGALFTVVVGKAPAVSCGLAVNREAADELWPSILELAKSMQMPVSDRQPPLPWLAVTILPGIARLDQERAMAMADLERCVAWTLIEDWKTDGGGA